MATATATKRPAKQAAKKSTKRTAARATERSTTQQRKATCKPSRSCPKGSSIRSAPLPSLQLSSCGETATEELSPRQAAAARAREIRRQLPRGYNKKKADERRRKMGTVDRAKSYPKEKFCELTGWGRLAWRRATVGGIDKKTGKRRPVLKVSRAGNGNVWVTGEAYFEWLREIEQLQSDSPGS